MLVFDLPSFPFVFKVNKDHTRRRRTPPASRYRASTSWSSSTVRRGRHGRHAGVFDVALPRPLRSRQQIDEILKFAPARLKYQTATATADVEVIPQASCTPSGA